MEKVKIGTYTVIYNGKNINADLSKYLISLSYTDKVDSESDEVALRLQDQNGLWRNQWIPTKGDKLEIYMGWVNAFFPCGFFEIDELNFSGPPDVVTIRGMAAPLSKRLNTKRSYAHENKTLKQLAETIAKRHNLTVTGEVNNELVIARSSQYRETDLTYLNRVAKDFGYIFSVRNETLIFTSIYNLEDIESVGELHRGEVSRYSFRDKTAETFKAATVKHSSPTGNELITGEVTGENETGNTLEVWTRAENVQQAEEIAKSRLHNANTRKQTARISVVGNIHYLSGVNIDLVGFGRLSGKYQIIESNHSIDSGGGYLTNFSAKKIQEINPDRWL